MLRWAILAIACLAASGCGAEPAEKAKGRGSAELTVTLPPTLPTERAAEDAPPEAGFENVAVVKPAAKAPPEPPRVAPAPKRPDPNPAPAEVEVAVAPAAEPAVPTENAAAADAPTPEPTAAASDPAPAARPAGASAWAGYLRKSGFPCRRVASAVPIERPAGPGLRFYRVECEGGGSYQATNKRGHLFFRRWRG